MKVKKNKKDGFIKLSASSMKTYTQCPKKYQFNYIVREKTKNWDHFDLGNIAHLTLELFHKEYMEDGTSKRTLGKIMSRSFTTARESKEFKNIKNHILVEAKGLLDTYLKSVVVSGMPIVKSVEKKFTLDINDKIIVRGVADRVDIMKDNRFHIVDYKTTKNKRYLEPFQLLVYGLWLKSEYPEMTSFKASYLLLRHDSALKSYEFNMEDLDACKKKILGYADKINNSIDSDTWMPIPTPLCNWCDFNKLCPAQVGW